MLRCRIAIAPPIIRSAPRPIDLIENPALGKMRLVCLRPAAEILDVHQLKLGEAICITFGRLLPAGTIVVLGGELLALGRKESSNRLPPLRVSRACRPLYRPR